MKSINGIPIFESGFVSTAKSISTTTTLDSSHFIVKITANCLVSLPPASTFDEHKFIIVNLSGVDILVTSLGGYIGNTGTSMSLTIKNGESYYLKNDGTKWLILASHLVSTGGGSSIITATSPIVEASWNGTQNYNKTFTVTGATLGQAVFVVLDATSMNTVHTGGNFIIDLSGWVSATNQVTVYGRIGSYASWAGGASWVVKIF